MTHSSYSTISKYNEYENITPHDHLLLTGKHLRHKMWLYTQGKYTQMTTTCAAVPGLVLKQTIWQCNLYTTLACRNNWYNFLDQAGPHKVFEVLSLVEIEDIQYIDPDPLIVMKTELFFKF